MRPAESSRSKRWPRNSSSDFPLSAVKRASTRASPPRPGVNATPPSPEPIWRFDERRAGYKVALVSINHLEQNGAQQLALDQRTVEISTNGQIELQLNAKSRLADWY